MVWRQATVSLAPKSRGCHVVTDEVLKGAGGALAGIRVGLCHLFLQHTSASLTLNESWSPDVLLDMEDTLNHIVPEGTRRKYRHDDEGPDDFPAHAKTTLVGVSLTIPITDGKLALGTWQGIYLNEHRDQGRSRRVIVTVQGEE